MSDHARVNPEPPRKKRAPRRETRRVACKTVVKLGAFLCDFIDVWRGISSVSVAAQMGRAKTVDINV